MLLGSWWLFLVFKLASKLNELNSPLMEGNLIKMIQWEGASFIILLFLLTVALFWVYLQDYRKNNALQAFFASLTHELKSPLASINLQAQVLSEAIEEMKLAPTEHEKLKKYITRLNQESTRLEDQLDNHLQLSRVERDAPVNLRAINLENFVELQLKRYQEKIKWTLDIPKDAMVLADDYALQIVFRNLIENTIKHTLKSHASISITSRINKDHIVLEYSDSGEKFTGELSKLTTLFYKHNSPKGTGIGLYLVKKLMLKMKGNLVIESNKGLVFKLEFSNKVEK